MAKLRGPANVYAAILYDICVENDIVDEVLYEIKSLSKVHDLEVRKVLSVPIISKEQKKAIIGELAKAGYKDEIVNLLKILIDNNELRLFNKILVAFQEIYQEKNDIVIVNVTVARQLESSQINEITTKLEAKLSKFVVLITDIDPKIIGGIKIEYDGTLIDNTIEKYTNELEKLAVL